jgi:hypothetical protein
VTRNSTSSERRGEAARVAVVLGLAGALCTPGCLQKGDTNVEVVGDAALGEAPTCVNVCGRVTANDDSWGGCGLFQPKDRAACIERCESVDAGAEAWRCVMSQPDCNTMFSECEAVF